MSQRVGQVLRRLRVPPLQRNPGRVAPLRRSLAAQRLVFGQPTEGDLLEFRLREVPGEPRDEPPTPLAIGMIGPRLLLKPERHPAGSA